MCMNIFVASLNRLRVILQIFYRSLREEINLRGIEKLILYYVSVHFLNYFLHIARFVSILLSN